MINAPVIAKRELITYFLSPIAYVVLTVFALVHGWLFVGALGGAQVDPNIVAGFAFWIAFYMMILFAPIITMRLLSEEASSGTIETLLTTPVSDMEVVLGKFFGALIFSMAMLVPIGVECLFLASVGQLDPGPVASGLLGLYLVIALFLAIGLFCSSLTRVQIGSAIMSIVVLLGLFFLWFVFRNRAGTLAVVFEYLAPPMHFSGFVKGVVDSRDLVYFVATAAFFLYLSVRVLESRKWR